MRQGLNEWEKVPELKLNQPASEKSLAMFLLGRESGTPSTHK